METIHINMRYLQNMIIAVVSLFLLTLQNSHATEIEYQHEDIAFNWIDTSAGTLHDIRSGNGYFTLPLDFNFEFYGQTQTEVKVDVNGYMTFGQYAQQWNNTPLPTVDDHHNMLAVHWDYVTTWSGKIYTLLEGDAPNRRLTVTWQDVTHYEISGTGITFQATLYEGTNEIVYRYLDVEFGNPAYDFGASATVGVENAFSTLGTQYSYNQAQLQNQQALRFFPVTNPGRANYENQLVSYDWIDTSNGTQHNLCSDCKVTVPLGFNFAFYDEWKQDTTISMNGFMSFDPNVSTQHLNRTIPNTNEPNDLVAVLWDDYYPGLSNEGNVQTLMQGTGPDRNFTITWNNVSRSGIGNATFQVTLYENSNNIIMRYKDIILGNVSLDYGKYATVGLEDSIAEFFTLYSYREAVIQDNMAILFTRPTTIPPEPPKPPVVPEKNYTIENIPYEWIDYSTATRLSMYDDYSVLVPIGFDFSFYDTNQTQLYVGSNGLLSFNSSGSRAYSNTNLPNANTPNNLIAPYWDDLNPSKAGGVYTQVDGEGSNRSFTITWAGVPHYSTSGTATFQVTLYEGSNDIVYRYMDVDMGSASFSNGANATVGVEDAEGKKATLHSYNSGSISNNSALRFHFQ